MHVGRSVLDVLLKSSSDHGLHDLEVEIDRDLTPRSRPLTGWTADLEIKVRRSIDVKNVVGVLDGSGPLANETVVIGAHYDHLGYGGPGSMANLKKPAIHHGADDNGSGTTMMMELARRFAQMKERQGRRLVFVAFTGEEMGLHGSLHYCKEPLFPLTDTVAMINLDMVGRLTTDSQSKKDRLTVYGTGTARSFEELLQSINKKHDLELQKRPGGSAPSDQATFSAKQIPVLFFYTGDHSDYHRPTDTVDHINFAGMERVASFVQDVVDYLAVVPEKPQYQKQPKDVEN